MSSPNGWSRSDHSSNSRGSRPLLLAHMLAMTRYGPRRSIAATRGGFIGWGPLTASHILQALYLELGLLGPMLRISVIRFMHWMNRCRGSSRRPIGGTWSCVSATRAIRSSGHNRYSPWSRRWRSYTATSSRCGVAVLHPVHNLHHLSFLHTITHLETTMRAFQILTMISIHNF